MKKLNTTKLLFLLTLFSGCQSVEPVAGGVAIRKLSSGPATALAPCPESPNCVTSFLHENGSDKNTLKPLQGISSVSQNKERLLKLLLLDKATIVTNSDSYIHATYSSKIWGFVDDVEFYLPSASIIHFRSASRSGYFDFGVNRARIEMLRFRLDQRE
jgi:uncharacterized protein (DUF1499 family)